jgi:hypothetical protein
LAARAGVQACIALVSLEAAMEGMEASYVTVVRLLIALVAAALLGLGFTVGALVHVSSNSLWIPVIAALGASLLTATAGFGIEAFRDAKAASQEAQHRRRGSGITLAGITRDPVAFLQQITREITPLNAAWTKVWLYGSQEAIEIANRFINASIPATSAATAQGKARPALLSRLVGEEWTKEQVKEFGEAGQVLGLARIEFAKVARKELDEADVVILAGIPEAEETISKTDHTPPPKEGKQQGSS